MAVPGTCPNVSGHGLRDVSGNIQPRHPVDDDRVGKGTIHRLVVCRPGPPDLLERLNRMF